MVLSSACSPSVSLGASSTPSTPAGIPRSADYIPGVEHAANLTAAASSTLLLPLSSPGGAPCLVVGKINGEILVFTCDRSQRVLKHDATSHSPITALAYGKLSTSEDQLVAISADGHLQSLRVDVSTPSISLIFSQLVQANIAAALVYDIDRDGTAELVALMTDRVVRTFRFSVELQRLVACNKWEVPSQISAVAIGESSIRNQEAWLSQVGTRQYVALRFSGDQNVSVCDSHKESTALIMPYRCHFLHIMGSLISNVIVYANQKERLLRSEGSDVVAAASVRLSSLAVVVTLDCRGRCLLYAYNERNIKHTELDPLLRLHVLPDASDVSSIAVADDLFIGVVTVRNRCIVYSVPIAVIKARFDSVT